MAKTVTDEQHAALELEHGAGRVLVLIAGAQEFAFRTHDPKKAAEMIEREQDGAKDMLELALRQALLCPEAPRGGKSVAEDLRLDPEERKLLADERALLETELRAVPMLGDVLGRLLATASGYGARINTDKDGAGGYLFVCKIGDEGDGEESVIITTRRPSREQYAVWREKGGDRWAAALYLFDALCSSGNGDEIKRRHPFIAYVLGSQILPGLGLEEVPTRVKKRPGSASPTP